MTLSVAFRLSLLVLAFEGNHFKLALALVQHRQVRNITNQLSSKPEEASKGSVNFPFTVPQRACIDDYLRKVGQLAPGFDKLLEKRRWGGTCNQLSSANRTKATFMNAGFGTTATKSLDCLFQQFGFKTHHWTLDDAPKEFWGQAVTHIYNQRNVEDPEECITNLNHMDFSLPWSAGYDVLGDSPIGNLFLDFYACNPHAKVLLTTRPAEKWLPARLKHGIDSDLPVESVCGLRLVESNVSSSVALFNAHDDLVRCIVPKDMFFEVDVFTRSTQGISKQIAKFAGLPEQDWDIEYPRVDKHDDDACWQTLVAMGRDPKSATPVPSRAIGRVAAMWIVTVIWIQASIASYVRQ